MHSFIPEDSSVVAEARYVPETSTLYIEFNGGGVYRYSNVSLSRYVFFRDSKSKGDFFARIIKANHSGSRLPHGFPQFTQKKISAS